MKADVFEHQDLALAKRGCFGLRVFADHVIGQGYLLPQKLRQTLCRGLHGELGVKAVLGPSKMGNQDDLRFLRHKVLDRRQGSDNALVVGDFAGRFIQRNIKVHADDHFFPSYIDVLDILFLHHSHVTLSYSLI